MHFLKLLFGLFFILSFGCQSAPTSAKKKAYSQTKCTPKNRDIPECDPNYYLTPDESKAGIESCLKMVKPGQFGALELKVVVHATGFVKFAAVQMPFENAQMESCLLRFAKRTQFEPTETDWKLIYPIKIKTN